MANSGVLLSEVVDIVSTKTSDNQGFDFIKLNTGLNDITRPALYGAQHAMNIVKLNGEAL